MKELRISGRTVLRHPFDAEAMAVMGEKKEEVDSVQIGMINGKRESRVDNVLE